jgi:hypothetical protein
MEYIYEPHELELEPDSYLQYANSDSGEHDIYESNEEERNQDLSTNDEEKGVDEYYCPKCGKAEDEPFKISCSEGHSQCMDCFQNLIFTNSGKTLCCGHVSSNFNSSCKCTFSKSDFLEYMNVVESDEMTPLNNSSAETKEDVDATPMLRCQCGKWHGRDCFGMTHRSCTCGKSLCFMCKTIIPSHERQSHAKKIHGCQRVNTKVIDNIFVDEQKYSLTIKTLLELEFKSEWNPFVDDGSLKKKAKVVIEYLKMIDRFEKVNILETHQQLFNFFGVAPYIYNPDECIIHEAKRKTRNREKSRVKTRSRVSLLLLDSDEEEDHEEEDHEDEEEKEKEEEAEEAEEEEEDQEEEDQKYDEEKFDNNRDEDEYHEEEEEDEKYDEDKKEYECDNDAEDEDEDQEYEYEDASDPEFWSFSDFAHQHSRTYSSERTEYIHIASSQKEKD